MVGGEDVKAAKNSISQLAQSILWALNFSGCNPRRQNRVSRFVWTILVSANTFWAALSLLHVIARRDSIIDTAEGFQFFCVVIQIVINMWVCRLGRATLQKLLDQNEGQFWGEEQFDSVLERRTRQWYRFFSRGISTFRRVNLAILFMYWTEILTKAYRTGSKALPVEIWLPFDLVKALKGSSYYYATTGLQIATIFYGVMTINIQCDCMFATLLASVIVQFVMLNHKLPMSSDKKHLTKCVNHHVLLLKFVTDMERVYSVAILQQLFSTVSVLCISFYLTTLTGVKNVRFPLAVVYYTFILFIYCRAGQELTQQSQSISESISNCGWELVMDKDVNRTVAMVVQRSQKPAKLSAGGFVNLTLETFSKIVRITVSFFTVLKSVTEK